MGNDIERAQLLCRVALHLRHVKWKLEFHFTDHSDDLLVLPNFNDTSRKCQKPHALSCHARLSVILWNERTLLHASICVFAHALTDFVAEYTIRLKMCIYALSCLCVCERQIVRLHASLRCVNTICSTLGERVNVPFQQFRNDMHVKYAYLYNYIL